MCMVCMAVITRYGVQYDRWDTARQALARYSWTNLLQPSYDRRMVETRTHVFLGWFFISLRFVSSLAMLKSWHISLSLDHVDKLTSWNMFFLHFELPLVGIEYWVVVINKITTKFSERFSECLRRLSLFFMAMFYWWHHIRVFRLCTKLHPETIRFHTYLSIWQSDTSLPINTYLQNIGSAVL